MLGIVFRKETVSAGTVKPFFRTYSGNYSPVDIVCLIQCGMILIGCFLTHAADNDFVIFLIVFGILDNHDTLILHTALIGNSLGSGVGFVQNGSMILHMNVYLFFLRAINEGYAITCPDHFRKIRVKLLSWEGDKSHFLFIHLLFFNFQVEEFSHLGSFFPIDFIEIPFLDRNHPLWMFFLIVIILLQHRYRLLFCLDERCSLSLHQITIGFVILSIHNGLVDIIDMLHHS